MCFFPSEVFLKAFWATYRYESLTAFSFLWITSGCRSSRPSLENKFKKLRNINNKKINKFQVRNWFLKNSEGIISKDTVQPSLLPALLSIVQDGALVVYALRGTICHFCHMFLKYLGQVTSWSSQNVPEMFNRAEIRWELWPAHPGDKVLFLDGTN